IEQPGFIYIFVYNRSDSPNWVFFDEMLVTHEHSSVVAGADYYPFGLAMDGREITDEPYRYGYQGQYAQENDSTGWNEFQLRMYDARFGRWLSVDPYGQYASPYVGMGNAPNIGVGPDGGWSWWTAGAGFVLGAAIGYAASDGDWGTALAAGLAGGLIGGASFTTDSRSVSAGSQTGGCKVLEEFIAPSAFGKSVGNFAANYGDDILLASTRTYIDLELRRGGVNDEVNNGWFHNYADPESFNLGKIGDAYYTNILPDDQHYALLYETLSTKDASREFCDAQSLCSSSSTCFWTIPGNRNCTSANGEDRKSVV